MKGLFSNAKNDVLAGLIVFLIALPLCLGIAQASNAPLFSGIVAGVVGGVVIGFLSKSNLSVSGPAAGLVAIVIGAIGQLGAFDIFLCAVIIAGALQLILGFVRAGSIANYFPSSVIEGMLAGIGITIILTQVKEAVGYKRPIAEDVMSDGELGAASQPIWEALHHVQPGAIIIALVCLAILVLWSTKAMKKVQMIPAGLVVVIVGTLLNQLFASVAPQYYLSGASLVSLPIPASATEFFGQFTLPNFSGFSNPLVWQTGVVIAVVASIETLLCIEATDKLDPLKRFTPGDSELKAQGIGNIVSGLIGGLPITSVIVRSSANINAGGRTKLSAITHGVLLLVCVAAIPFILNMIPKASLAAILIFTGYRLCRPAIFSHMWHAGKSQFIPFLITAVAVVGLDLLKGVGIGMAIAIVYLLKNNMNIPFYFKKGSYRNKQVLKLELAQEVSFLNKASIKQTLDNLPENSSIVLDATNTFYIDYDVLELIREFTVTQAKDRNIKISLIGFQDQYEIPNVGNLDDVEAIEYAPENAETSKSYKSLITELAK